jgi:hypothetical protein
MFIEDARYNTSCDTEIAEYEKLGWAAYKIYRKLIHDGKKISHMTVWRKVKEIRGKK